LRAKEINDFFLTMNDKLILEGLINPNCNKAKRKVFINYLEGEYIDLILLMKQVLTVEDFTEISPKIAKEIALGFSHGLDLTKFIEKGYRWIREFRKLLEEGFTFIDNEFDYVNYQTLFVWRMLYRNKQPVLYFQALAGKSWTTSTSKNIPTDFVKLEAIKAGASPSLIENTLCFVSGKENRKRWLRLFKLMKDCDINIEELSSRLLETSRPHPEEVLSEIWDSYLAIKDPSVKNLFKQSTCLKEIKAIELMRKKHDKVDLSSLSKTNKLFFKEAVKLIAKQYNDINMLNNINLFEDFSYEYMELFSNNYSANRNTEMLLFILNRVDLATQSHHLFNVREARNLIYNYWELRQQGISESTILKFKDYPSSTIEVMASSSRLLKSLEAKGIDFFKYPLLKRIHSKDCIEHLVIMLLDGDITTIELSQVKIDMNNFVYAKKYLKNDRIINLIKSTYTLKNYSLIDFDWIDKFEKLFQTESDIRSYQTYYDFLKNVDPLILRRQR